MKNNVLVLLNASDQPNRPVSSTTAILGRPALKWILAGMIGLVTTLGGGCAPTSLPATPVATAIPSSTPEPPTPTQTVTPVEPVLVAWWPFPGAGVDLYPRWKQIADAYESGHPNVKIELTYFESESYDTRLTAALQAGSLPDVFESWGGYKFMQLSQAGALKDITADLDADGGAWRSTFTPSGLALFSHEGKSYGVPWDLSMAGWWYNKELFRKAGIAAPPATWSELLADVKKLKTAGITPISLGEGDRWPGLLLWSYLAARICGQAGLEAAASRQGSFADPCFVEAGRKLQELIALKPFQQGYLDANHDAMQAAFGNGQAAMELCGSWTPDFQATRSADQKGIGANLDLFRFPAVEGGAGDMSDVVGGSNGFLVSKDAKPEAVDFLKYLTNRDNQMAMAQDGSIVPVVKGSEAALTDPNLLLVQKHTASAQYFVPFFDQLVPKPAEAEINQSVHGLFAGTLTPEQVAQNLENAVGPPK